MKILMMINDQAYKVALSRVITTHKKEINIIYGRNNSIIKEDYDMILTDGDYKKDDSFKDMDLRHKVIYLVREISEDNTTKFQESEMEASEEYKRIFKYKGARYIISDIMWFYYMINNISTVKKGSGVIVSVFSDDGVNECTKYIRKLGADMVSEGMNKVLIIPLKYINLTDNKEVDMEHSFKRFMYYICAKKNIEPESFFFNDIHGIYRMKNNEIINPIANLKPSDFDRFIDVLINNAFDVIIFDIGNCLNGNNLNLIKISDYRIIVYERKNFRLIKELKEKCRLDDKEIINMVENGGDIITTYDTKRIIESVMKRAIIYDKKF